MAAERTQPEPPESLRAFGSVFQAFREHAGLTQEELAPKMGYSVSQLASVEQGRRFPSRKFVERAEQTLNAFGVIRKVASQLNRQRGLASWFRQWAGKEAEAIILDTYEPRVIPGLLQTEAYARVLFEGQVPAMSAQQIEVKLAARLDRQRLLTEHSDRQYSFILEEHLFHHRVGGPEVTRELIDHILKAAELPNVEVQIVPLDRGHHTALDGPMQLAETPEHEWLAYSEGQRTGQLISDPNEISVLRTRYGKLRGQALSPRDSKGLLSRLRGAL